MSRLRSVRSVQAPIASPKRSCGAVKIASVAPSASADPVSLKTIRGSANCVTELPKFETVSPVQYFQKSRFSRQHLLSRPSWVLGRHVGRALRDVLGECACVGPLRPDRLTPRLLES